MKESNILLYETEDGKVNVDVILKDETIWLTQKSMGELFSVDRTVITKHLKNIFEEKELSKNSVCAKFAHTAKDGKNYQTEFYNLDAIIAVGYRVNSKKATQFRIWATNILKEYIIKGFALNDERFIKGNKYDSNYFEELLERIKTIRVSERMAYQKIIDLFEELTKLNNLTNIFLVFAEDEAKERHVMTMKDWIQATDDLLKFRRKKVLDNSGNISHKEAIEKAENEYEKYRIKQDKEYISSMDLLYNKYLKEEIKNN